MENNPVDAVSYPAPPTTTWEELEDGQAGQLGFPGLSSASAPTIAERAFVRLAREWHAEASRNPIKHPLPRAVDVLALSCLLLSVEWGHEFSIVARDQIAINRIFAENRGSRSWHDGLSWNLCMDSRWGYATRGYSLEVLTSNLSHHDSSIRAWMMEIGWFVRSWLDSAEATRRLLKNVADTLLDTGMAFGLAARLFVNADEFMAIAREFVPPSSFEDQYQSRLKFLSDYGILETQAPFWRLECRCRHTIESAVLGRRLVPESTSN